MHLKTLYMPIALILFTNISCGVFNRNSSSENVTKTTHGPKPDVYELQDPECTEEDATGNFDSNVKIWISNESGQVEEQTFDLSSVSRNGLQSEIIENTIYFNEEIQMGHEHSAILPMPPTMKTTDFSDKLLLSKNIKNETLNRRQKTLRFCRPNGGYDRRSRENVALAAFIGIKKAYDAHQSLGVLTDSGGHAIDSKLKKCTLIIHPVLYKMDGNHKMYSSNNAFWTFDEKIDDLPFIAVLPHSLESAQSHGYSVKFWEQPAIFSHEYGHHIFHHYGKNMIRLSSDLSKSKSLVSNGLNEGFADLVSLYSINPETYLTHVYNFGDDPFNDPDTRDPFKSSFKVTEMLMEKVFTKDMTNIMTHEKTYNRSTDPDKNYWQECHSIGAVVAHTLNHTFDANLTLKGNDREKLKHSILTLHSLDQAYSGSQVGIKASDLLENILFNFVSASKPDDLSTADEWKKAVNDKFPAYSSSWLFN